MNSTVWNKQIDKGLIEYLHSILGVPVRVRKADEDFKKEDYPMVIIQNTQTSKRDPLRYNPFELIRVSDSQGVVQLEHLASPHTLTYQITIATLLQSEMNELTAKWNLYVENHFNLPVKDSGGNTQYANCFQKGDGFNRQDKLGSISRTFLTTFTYEIWGEVDFEDSSSGTETEYLVSDIELTTKSD